MVKELCFRCHKPVYPTDKVGPLKDGAFFHQGCFKCYICGTRLTLKSYCNNRNDTCDQEVYCNSHVPLAGPHDPNPALNGGGAQSAVQVPLPDPVKWSGSAAQTVNVVVNGAGNGPYLVNGGGGMAAMGQAPAASPASTGHGHSVSPRPRQNYRNTAGCADMHVAHALKAQALAKPYPKITHPGARYMIDYDAQTRLEMLHRQEEDRLYQQFIRDRQEEESRFNRELQEEWERTLASYTLQNGHQPHPHAHRQNHAQASIHHQNHASPDPQAKADLLRHFTIKRDKRRETMQQKRRDRERAKTAELVDVQATEMLQLFKEARRNEDYIDGAVDEQNISSSRQQQEYPPTPPPPMPPHNRKRDIYTDVSVFETVDQTAISCAMAEQRTFTELVRALAAKCKTDVDVARAIYRWITVKNLNLMRFDDSLDANTPMGLLRGIKYGTESYHVLFKRLCAYAGLHCVVVKGYSKSAGYQPGMHFADGRFRNTWNSVFLDGAWRFVQCNWGARHLVNAKDQQNGHAQNGLDGVHGAQNGHAAQKSDNLRYEYDDHYFMTDPEEFIYEFWPHEPEWQLLPQPISLRQFEELPFVRSLFFRYGLSFADRRLRAMISTDSSGAATVAINMSPDALSTLIFHYNLRNYHDERADYNGVSLKRFVMQSVVGHSVVLRVHAPAAGDFLLDIFANAVTAGEYLTGNPMKFKSVCKFKVTCDKLNMIMVPLPECASGEWGPAKAYRLFGLIPLTHEDAIINSGRDLQIKMRMSKPLAEFVCALHKNRIDDKRLSRCAVAYPSGDAVTFKIAFPEEGQYGLDIYTREANSGNGGRTSASGKQLLTHCCKYLINVRL